MSVKDSQFFSAINILGDHRVVYSKDIKAAHESKCRSSEEKPGRAIKTC